MADVRGDRELLTAVRSGETAAFEELWTRHREAAARYARRALPSRVDDLVSEAFLAIYQQVTTTTTGPTDAFRPYLKAVIRNTALRWRRAEVDLSDRPVEDIGTSLDALTLVERDDERSDLSAALEGLPPRWRRLLWLAEVEGADRRKIAEELGISANAVSALRRRATSGLARTWLAQQIPPLLRDDPTHAARILPDYVNRATDPRTDAAVRAHIATCGSCADLLHALRSRASRTQRTLALVLIGSATGSGAAAAAASTGGGTVTALGLGSLASGGTASSTAGGSAAAGVASSTAGGSAAAGVAAGVGVGVGALSVLAVGGVTASLLLLAPLLGTAAPDAADAAAPLAPPPVVSAGSPVLPAAENTAPTEAAPTTPAPEATTAPRVGRGVEDPNLTEAALVLDPATLPLPPSDRPTPLAQSGTATPTPAPTSSAGPTPDPAAATTGYLAPALTGRGRPGDTVTVDVDGSRYAADTTPDGSWTFDARRLSLPAGTYPYAVTSSSTDGTVSTRAGSFTIVSLGVRGFEGLAGIQDMTVDEASTTGLVIEVDGPPDATVLVVSMTGHAVQFALDGDGHARKRLVMAARGWYYLTFRVVDGDGRWGPGTERAVDVYDPDIIFDPWGPSPEEMTFDLTEP